MKKHWLILLTIICLLSGSCQQSTTYPPAMRQAESLMEIYPDSADCLLQDLMDSISSYPEETQRYYQLLRIQANDKLYITHRSDSLINLIVDFYEKLGDEEKLMKAYYYQGSVYRDMNDAPKALKSFQQAIDLNCPDYDLQARTYGQMGYLFAYKGLYKEALAAHKKSMDIYKEIGANRKIPFCQRDIARMYQAQNATDSALFYYKEACNTALANNDSARYLGTLSELGTFYYRNNQTDLSKQILSSLEKNRRIEDKENIYLYLGYLYEDAQQLDSAIYYYRKVLVCGSISQRFSANQGLSRIEEESSDYLSAHQYLKKAFFLKDTVDMIAQTEALAKIKSLYNYQHTEKENYRLKLKQKKVEQNYLYLCIGLMLIGSYAFFKYKRNSYYIQLQERKLETLKKEKEMQSITMLQKNKEKLKTLNNLLENANEQNDSLKRQLLQVQKEKLELINKEFFSNEKEKQLRIELLRSSEIYSYFHKTGENKATPKHWQELQEAIDAAYPDFTRKLHNLYPQTTLIECQVCWLTKIEISPSNIAVWINHSRTAVSNIKKRFYKKVHGKEGTPDDFYKFIADL